ncbi:EpsG family protein [Polynucleobacter sp. HIN7]|uniref:EpsG family protein n=1 Tax=Polynucleobacter sp. HIN7 TaxID=3047866 RepID=UPI002573BA0C|nr:EpsG family protein [Polynucleobacter sp. HIN7]
MEIYYLIPALAISAGLLSILGNKYDQIYLLFFSVAIFLICGFRYNSDIDYPGYFEIYERIPALTDLGADDFKSIYGEPLFILAGSFFKLFTSDYQLYLIILVAISIFGKAFFISKFTRYSSAAFGIYLCFHFITVEFIQVRWAVSTSLLALSLFFLINFRYLYVIIFAILAINFHYYSSVIVLIILIAYFVSIKKAYLIFYLCSIIFLLKLFDIFEFYRISDINFFSNYIKNQLNTYGNNDVSIGFLGILRVFFCIFLASIVPVGYSREILILKKTLIISTSVALIGYLIGTIFYYRTLVFCDLIFSVILFSRMTLINSKYYKLLYFLIILLYNLWFIIDINNNIYGKFITEYIFLK